MKRAGGLFIAVVFAGGIQGQTITRSFGSVIFPGGTSATNPNITRTFGSVVFPGGSPTTPVVRTGPAIAPPAFIGRPSSFNGGNSFNRGSNAGNSFNRGTGTPARGRRTVPASTVYAYPVYVPGYFDSSYAPSDGIAPQVQPDSQPNVTVVYPQQPETARPVMIQVPQTQPSVRAYVPEEQTAATESDTHYLVAFKDHTIYSTVAYWFDGDTLHFFTKGDTHNQAPVALIDRDLTERLNREMGIDFRLPPAK